MSAQLATRNDTDTAAILEQVVVNGNLAGLLPAQRVIYYRRVCESLGLNELTRPFEYLELDGKLTFYVTKSATDQLRKLNGISVEPVIETVDHETYTYRVRVRASTPDGRVDFATGVVAIGKEDGEWKTAQSSGKRYFAGNGQWVMLKGAERANAEMRAETKAKRRATLSICGLGWLDESELDTVPQARKVQVDFATGEIVDGTSSPDRVAPAQTPAPEPPKSARPDFDRVRALFAALHVSPERQAKTLGEMGCERLEELTTTQAAQLIERMDKALKAKTAEATSAPHPGPAR